MSDIWEYGGAADEPDPTRRAGAGADPGTGPGTGPGAGPGADPGAGPGAESVTDPSQRGFPWPPPEQGGVLGAFGETWKSATFDPGRFFAAVPRDTGTGAAVLYYLVIGVLVAGVTLFWDVLGQFGAQAVDQGLGSELGLGAMQPLTRFLLSPLLLLLALGLSAGAVHVLLLMLGGARHGFDTTLRVFCYSYSPMLFGVVPVLGALVGTVWMVVLAIIGLREGHQVEGWKPAVAVLVPFVLLVIATLVMVLMLWAATAALLGRA